MQRIGTDLGRRVVTAIPTAWLLAIAPRKLSSLLFSILLLSMWTNLLARTFAWMVLLQQTGPINRVLMALGGRVAGGRIYGKWPGLKAEELEEGVDLAVANYYRQALSEIIGHWRPAADTSGIFPGFKPGPNLGLLG